MVATEMYDLIDDSENGFQGQRSTTDHLSTLTGIVEHRIKNGQETFVCFVDFHKA